jgi:3-phenylpropionate/trans-cinnamate dioxygenase ferredoxin reductase subunit
VKTNTTLIVGASLAGAMAAKAARSSDSSRRVVVIGDEDYYPYERPPLSKGVLRGEKSPDTAQIIEPSFYDEHDIQLVLGRRVDTLDIGSSSLSLDNGEALSFGSVVLATGSEPRMLTVPGHDLIGVHYLRTLGDSVRLQDAIHRSARVAVIGGGWIGCEVAASARQMGREVVLVYPTSAPLQSSLGEEMGAVFAGLHGDHGVALRPHRNVVGVAGTHAVEGVELDNDRGCRSGSCGHRSNPSNGYRGEIRTAGGQRHRRKRVPRDQRLRDLRSRRRGLSETPPLRESASDRTLVECTSSRHLCRRQCRWWSSNL